MKNWTACTKAEKIARWENVERVLKNLSPHERRKHWNMANWGIKTECGTVACAAGHCGLDPWFRRRGLKLIPSEVEEIYVEKGGFGDFFLDGNPYLNAPEIVIAFFGSDGTHDIFFNSSKRPVREVIREVRAYLKDLNLEDDET